MKIRNGYVSNSSSSSFCISECYMGICSSSPSYKSIKYDSNIFSNLSFFVGEDNVIGINVERMMDNETKNEFRNRVFLELQKFGFNGNEDEVNWRLPEFAVECVSQYY
jgi:hypothetical protein